MSWRHLTLGKPNRGSKLRIKISANLCHQKRESKKCERFLLIRDCTSEHAVILGSFNYDLDKFLDSRFEVIMILTEAPSYIVMQIL